MSLPYLCLSGGGSIAGWEESGDGLDLEYGEVAIHEAHYETHEQLHCELGYIHSNVWVTIGDGCVVMSS